MKAITFIFLFIVTITFSFAQSRDCLKFKTGTFRYLDKDLRGVVIARNDSIQVEYSDKNEIRIYTSIVWQNECNYILTYTDIENYPKKNEIIGRKIYVEIIETNGNKYKCNVVTDDTEQILEFVKE